MRTNSEAVGQNRAAALVCQEDCGTPDGQPREVSLVPTREGPQTKGLHQGLILLQFVGPQVHLQNQNDRISMSSQVIGQTSTVRAL